MKTLLNWRYYVMTVLFGVGALALARAFSLSDTMPLSEWSIQFLLSMIVGLSAFVIFGRLGAYWIRRGEISDY